MILILTIRPFRADGRGMIWEIITEQESGESTGENQFDININGTDFKSFSYPLENVKWLNDLKTGGSSDQSLIFTAPHSNVALINGMLPGGKQ